jgi:two-component SAPR family response regulator
MVRNACSWGESGFPRPTGRYRPERGLFAVDLWRFQQAIDQARHAGDDEAATAALRAAADAYGGSLLDGEPYGWSEPARQGLRDQAVDALSRLAELRERAGDDRGALAATAARWRRWSGRSRPTRWLRTATGG